MSETATPEGEWDRQKALLLSAIGQEGSGSVRYAAAMFFYSAGKMTAEMLEIYRRCCVLDDEDPMDLAQFEGIEPTLSL